MNGTEAVPRPVRRALYVVVVVANAAAVILNGFDLVTAEHLVAILAGLGVLSSGLALGYVPARNLPDPHGAAGANVNPDA